MVYHWSYFFLVWDIVGPLFLNSVNYALETGQFHRDQNTLLITLLLKTGKDPLDCASFRPISLICCDVKVFAKVLMRRIKDYASRVIDYDQTSFIRGRTASGNIRRLSHIINSVHTSPEPIALFSLDALKAFDRLEWNYMWAVLENIGFGPKFIGMLKPFYNSPTVCVMTGFRVMKGFRERHPSGVSPFPYSFRSVLKH